MPKLPEHAVTIETYREFHDDMRRFADLKYNFILVIGNSGTGKTEAVKDALGIEECAVVSGHMSPFGFYCWCYDNIDKVLVLDDVNPNLFKADACIAMLKKLTETSEEKVLNWTTKQVGDDKDYPKSFVTSSRVIMLCNEWDSVSEHVRAIEGRAFTIVFEPTAQELHKQVGKWFNDKEVYEFIGSNLGRITKPNMRLYVKAKEQKDAGADWVKRTLEMMEGNTKMKEIMRLLMEAGFKSSKERCAAFIAGGHGSRATFYRALKELKASGWMKEQEEEPKLLEE